MNDKGDNPKRPDYTGKLNVEGVDYKVSGWINKSKNGKEYYSLKLQKDTSSKQTVEVEDEIPF